MLYVSYISIKPDRKKEEEGEKVEEGGKEKSQQQQIWSHQLHTQVLGPDQNCPLSRLHLQIGSSAHEDKKQPFFVVIL